MPPKPWEKRGRVAENTVDLSKQIELNNSESSKMAEEAIASEPLPENANQNPTGENKANANSLNSGLNSTGYGGGGYGSSYGGGYGSGYGGGMYGSSMYGGGMYGGGMYGGGMYGGGMMGGMYGNRFGMMGDPNNPNSLMKTMQYLDSIGYVVQSLVEISRNLEMNAEGLGRFWGSVHKLYQRIKGWGKHLIYRFFKIFIDAYHWINNKVNDVLNIITGSEQSNLYLKKKILSQAIRITCVFIVISLFPTMRSMLNSSDDTSFEDTFQ